MSVNVTMRSARRTGRRGFTLLEILLVVGLLALLAAFAIPALSSSGEKAKVKIAEAAVKSNGTISQSIDLYKFECGKYPEELKYLFEKPTDDEVGKKWAGPYIKDPDGLKDPWGRDYQYAAPGSHNEQGYDLWSMGPDGVDGNEDDIRNWKTD
ncbi:MAG: type II secretion system major pseudopilin GspG [Phycisphaerae bacterium]|nr:type II secretion system major pseudopilin GspG [Phycisphaerae bacterium]